MAIVLQNVAFGIFKDLLSPRIPPDDMLVFIHDVHAIRRIANHVKVFWFAHEDLLPDNSRIV
jgi:hypothetical protein